MLSYHAAYATIRRLTKKAGLRKRIYPHLFRHSHATMLARQGVNEAILNEHHGWVQGSRSAAGYMHVAGRDTDKELARLQGLRVEENGTNVEFKIRKCTRCGKMSSPVSKLCSSCGLAFDAPNAERIDKLREKADKLISVLMQDEHMLDKLLNKIDELRSS